MSKRTETKLDAERTCIVTRAKAAPGEMLRFVRAPDGTVVPDLRHKLPGRGVWVVAHAATVAQAVKKKAFARGFKAEVRVAETLPKDIDALMEQDCLQALSFAKKAGQLVAGFGKIETAAQNGGVVALINASDGAADGSRKLEQAVRRGGGTADEIKLFTATQLSLALGGTNVIHAALTEGAAGAAFLAQCRRLALYRSAPSALVLPTAPADEPEPAEQSMG